ncbi:FT-interacting protein 4-like [Lolium perenne]|uniref:FT-interacting protein 4-like n=1 Tax=Lolium perenne TaxID=4522 RepID=UPI003A99D1A5
MPRAASTSPRLAMVASQPPPGQTVDFPRHAGPAPAQSPGSVYDLVETKAPLPAKLGPRSAAAKIPCTFDMVEPMSYLYVTVVKARDLPTMEITDSVDLYVEVKMGKFRGLTLMRHLEKNASPEWRQTFAFSRDHLVYRGDVRQFEVIVRDKEMLREDSIGLVVFDMSDVPSRLPSDSELAPQWYQLSDAHGNRLSRGGHGLGEIMLAIWLGTQADDAFPEAWHADAHSLSLEELTSTRCKVYYSPKLIYLKVSVITAQDLVASETGRPLEDTIAKIQMGNQIWRTSPRGGTANPVWEEDLMFVVRKPFVDPLVVTVEERVADRRDEPIGRVIIPVEWPHLPRNDLARSVPTKWFSLSRVVTTEASEDVATVDEGTLASKIQLKMSLETAYHVLDESSDYSSDLQPAAKKLRKSAIGILEVGILSARGLGGIKNLYCVAKYGAKWVRTRTLLATAAPQWNEQYAWEVFDLSTVITIVVFDNANLHHGHGGKDQRIGKVRVRLSTLEAGRVHTHHYPLLALSPSGLMKTRELQLAVRFTCKSWSKMLVQYGRPLLPKMHYTNPISVPQLDYLQFQAMQIVANQLEQSDPPLPREVVEYMLDPDSQFSHRRSKANYYRLTSLISVTVAAGKWFDDTCKWKNPSNTILIYVVFITLVWNPRIILPLVLMYMIMIGVWNYPWRPRRPPRIDMMLSQVELALPDELEEELDTLRPSNILPGELGVDSVLNLVLWYADPAHANELNEELDTSTKPDGIVRKRYDRLRRMAAKTQRVVGDLAMKAERAESLLRWRDPWVTPIFTTLSLVMAVVLYFFFFFCEGAVVLYLTPFWLVAMMMGLYFFRPPQIRSSTNRRNTNLLFNVYTRLPSKDDMLL